MPLSLCSLPTCLPVLFHGSFSYFVTLSTLTILRYSLRRTSPLHSLCVCQQSPSHKSPIWIPLGNSIAAASISLAEARVPIFFFFGSGNRRNLEPHHSGPQFAGAVNRSDKFADFFFVFFPLPRFEDLNFAQRLKKVRRSVDTLHFFFFFGEDKFGTPGAVRSNRFPPPSSSMPATN